MCHLLNLNKKVGLLDCLIILSIKGLIIIKNHILLLQLRQLRKTHAEVFVAMCRDHFQAELNVTLKHSTPIYDTLRSVMDQDHRDHEQSLRVIIHAHHKKI